MLGIIFIVILYFSLMGSLSINLRVRKILKLSIDWEFYILILMIANFLIICWFYGDKLFYIIGLGYLYGILIGPILWLVVIFLTTLPLGLGCMLFFKISQIVLRILKPCYTKLARGNREPINNK